MFVIPKILEQRIKRIKDYNIFIWYSILNPSNNFENLSSKKVSTIYLLFITDVRCGLSFLRGQYELDGLSRNNDGVSYSRKNLSNGQWLVARKFRRIVALKYTDDSGSRVTYSQVWSLNYWLTLQMREYL